MTLPPIRAVLFDWGDTLFYSPSAPRVIVEAAGERGVSVDEETARRIWDEVWEAGKRPEELAKGRDLSPDTHRAVWMSLFAATEVIVPGLAEILYERVMDPTGWLPYDDTAPTLRALRDRGVGVGVVSNIARDLRPAFERHGLRDLVGSFVLSYEHGAVKPEAALFLTACLELGTAPNETLMVGDHPLTDGGAAAAGLSVYLLPRAAATPVRGLARVLALVDASRSRAGGS